MVGTTTRVAPLVVATVLSLLVAGCGEHRSSVVLEPVGSASTGDLELAAAILRSRLDLVGARRVHVRVDRKTLVIQSRRRLAGPLLRLLTTTGNLEFFDLETSLVGRSGGSNGSTPTPTASLFRLLSSARRNGAPAAYYLFDARKRTAAGPASTIGGLLTLANRKTLPKGWTLLSVPHDTEVISCSSSDRLCPGPRDAFVPSGTVYYLFVRDPSAEKIAGVEGVPQLTGSDLERPGSREGVDPATNEPVVLLAFTRTGSGKFRKTTAAEWERGRKRGNTPQHFAIVFDGEIKSFPQIDPTDSSLAGGISGNAEITGIRSSRDAKALALALRTGALPFRLVRVR